MKRILITLAIILCVGMVYGEYDPGDRSANVGASAAANAANIALNKGEIDQLHISTFNIQAQLDLNTAAVAQVIIDTNTIRADLNQVQTDTTTLKKGLEDLSAGGFPFYLTNAASGSNGYYLMPADVPSGAESTIVRTIDAATVIIASFTTASPLNLSLLRNGIFEWHFHASVDNPTRNVNLRGTVYHSTGSAMTVLFSGELTSKITTESTKYNIHGATEEINIPIGFIVTVITAEASGGGPDPDLTIYMEGDNTSRFAMPILASDITTTKIIAGTEISISPLNGLGPVIINVDAGTSISDIAKSTNPIVANTIAVAALPSTYLNISSGSEIQSNKGEIDELHLTTATQQGEINTNGSNIGTNTGDISTNVASITDLRLSTGSLVYMSYNNSTYRIDISTDWSLIGNSVITGSQTVTLNLTVHEDIIVGDDIIARADLDGNTQISFFNEKMRFQVGGKTLLQGDTLTGTDIWELGFSTQGWDFGYISWDVFTTTFNGTSGLVEFPADVWVNSAGCTVGDLAVSTGTAGSDKITMMPTGFKLAGNTNVASLDSRAWPQAYDGDASTMSVTYIRLPNSTGPNHMYRMGKWQLGSGAGSGFLCSW